MGKPLPSSTTKISSTERFQVTVSASLKHRIRIEAAKRRKTMAEITEDALQAWLDKATTEGGKQQ